MDDDAIAQVLSAVIGSATSIALALIMRRPRRDDDDRED